MLLKPTNNNSCFVIDSIKLAPDLEKAKGAPMRISRITTRPFQLFVALH